ncbi:MAG: phospholipase D-like domain-containing protein [Candidatus Muiribacteriota bacterium]
MKKIISIILFLFLFALTSFSTVSVYFNNPPVGAGIDTALIELVDSAERTIDAHFYQVNNMDIIRAFERAAKRLGSDNVRFITEDKYFNQDNYKDKYGVLLRAGIDVKTDRSGDGITRGQCHNKFAVIDGKYVWTGSYNITDNGTSRNSNNALKIESRELADYFTDEFNQMYEDGLFSIRKKEYKTPAVRVGEANINVMFSPQESVKNQMIQAIGKAREGIYFNIFTYTDEAIMQAMIRKAREGVPIYGVFDSFQAGGQYSAFDEMNQIQQSLPTLNVKKDDNSGFLHHKFMVIDPLTKDATVITGSKNWTLAADRVNDENTLFVNSEEVAMQYYYEVAKQYGEGFDYDINDFEFEEPEPTGPTILVTEVSFKNHSSHGDWVELYVADDFNNGNGYDIGGYYLYDDEAFKVFEPGTIIKTGDYILVSQGVWSDDKNSGFNGILNTYVPELSFHTTDEQVMFFDADDEMIDAVAWANMNGRWSHGERDDMMMVFAAGQWNNYTEDSCVDGGQISGPDWSLSRRFEKSMSDIKYIDTNSPSDWDATDNITSGEDNSY